MRKTYLILGLFVASLHTNAQRSDTVHHKNLSKTDIEILFNYYAQDGKHSAVTGGLGTEKLTVYGPQLKINSRIGDKHFVSFKAGMDIITSASTDKIDFIQSSASYEDRRVFGQIGYAHRFKKQDLQAGATIGISMESDYLAIPVSFQTSFNERSGMRSYSFRLSASLDDLRWGRVNPDYLRPEKLVYPKELRYKEWSSEYLRQSFHLQTSISQVVSRRAVFNIFPELVYQRGLLATPFHRVYFTDGSLRVENLPKHRLKIPLGIQLNYFAGKRTVIRSFINYYSDNFGINAFDLQLELPIKVVTSLTLAPFFRFHYQTASKYFKPRSLHHPTAVYYTSDYDLSKFESYTSGLNIRYAPYAFISRGFAFSEIHLRYSCYYRSDRMLSHMLTTAFVLSAERK